VILPDTAEYNPPQKDMLYRMGDTIVWTMGGSENPEALSAARDAAKALREEENARLLYVAMTRAEKWLIVAAAGEVAKNPTWYSKISDGAAALGAVPWAFAIGSGARYEHGDWPTDSPTVADTAPPALALPHWVYGHSAPAPKPEEPLNPSALGGAKALAGDGDSLTEEAAMQRGSQLHLLLEHLANWEESEWTARALDLLKLSDLVDTDMLESLIAEAAAVLRAPGLQILFGPDALVEVDIVANLFERPMTGTIDRLVVTDTKVLAVDYKSNAIVPKSIAEIPDGLLRQMAAYAQALQQIYPDRAVECALLWTRTAQLMPLPQLALDAALERASLDHAPPHT
jgi:ATP-dependent helicase/nuclease subunit A